MVLKTPKIRFKNVFSYKMPKPMYYLSVVAAGVGCVCLVKDWAGGDKFSKTVDMTGKVVIVTGSNTGIGKQTAWEMARRNAKVYLACRDMKRCEKAREEIVLDTKNKYVYCRPCDLASLQSIQDFVKTFKSEEKNIHVLVNNAGVMRTPEGSKTKEGFEMQLGVNHLGHFLLTNLLLDVLKESAPSRIINVTSIAHTRGKINKEDLNSTKEYNAGGAYAQSKLANVLFTKELANRLEGTKVTVNAVHPGLVDTHIVRHMGIFNNWFSKFVLKPFVWPFIKSPVQGAQTIIYMALEPDLNNVSGKYFSNCKEIALSAPAEDVDTSKWLWSVSEKWTRLNA